MRGYVFFDEDKIEYDENDEPTLKHKIREEMVQKLASECNEINNRIEQRSWRDRDELDSEADYHAEMADEFAYSQLEKAEKLHNSNGLELSPEDHKLIREKAINLYYEQKASKDNEIHLRKQVIEDLLSELGARMMRPYEHWNEEERYMEYMETRYDY